MTNKKIKKVLITGADGFIGSHLTEMLVKKGYDVRALCKYNSFSNLGWLDKSRYLKSIDIILGDIEDEFIVSEAMKNIDVVFNLAALISIPYSYKAYSSYLKTNVNGTLNLLKIALENNVQKFIQTSTSEVYGSALYVPIDENHPLQPQSPYSASKISSDAFAMSFFNSFSLPVVLARPFNTYGPRQSARAIIPTIITQILNNEKNLKLGSLFPTRDFNYISDTCSAFILIAESDDTIGKEINFGSGKETSIDSLVKTICKIMDVEINIIQNDNRVRPENSEVDRLLCNNKLINELTGYEPKISLKSGIKKTFNWFKDKKNLSFYNSGRYNI